MMLDGHERRFSEDDTDFIIPIFPVYTFCKFAYMIKPQPRSSSTVPMKKSAN